MDWIIGNSFFLIVLLLCVGMHLFHGHGGHGNRGDKDATKHDRHEHP